MPLFLPPPETCALLDEATSAIPEIAEEMRRDPAAMAERVEIDMDALRQEARDTISHSHAKCYSKKKKAFDPNPGADKAAGLIGIPFVWEMPVSAFVVAFAYFGLPQLLSQLPLKIFRFPRVVRIDRSAHGARLRADDSFDGLLTAQDGQKAVASALRNAIRLGDMNEVVRPKVVHFAGIALLLTAIALFPLWSESPHALNLALLPVALLAGLLVVAITEVVLRAQTRRMALKATLRCVRQALLLRGSIDGLLDREDDERVDVRGGWPFFVTRILAVFAGGVLALAMMDTGTVFHRSLEAQVFAGAVGAIVLFALISGIDTKESLGDEWRLAVSLWDQLAEAARGRDAVSHGHEREGIRPPSVAPEESSTLPGGLSVAPPSNSTP